MLGLKPILIEDEQMLRHLMGKSIELMTELEPSLGLVRANSGCMHPVLMNLAVNARDAMPNGGGLVIAIERGHRRDPLAAAGRCRARSIRPIERDRQWDGDEP